MPQMDILLDSENIGSLLLYLISWHLNAGPGQEGPAELLMVTSFGQRFPIFEDCPAGQHGMKPGQAQSKSIPTIMVLNPCLAMVDKDRGHFIPTVWSY